MQYRDIMNNRVVEGVARLLLAKMSEEGLRLAKEGTALTVLEVLAVATTFHAVLVSRMGDLGEDGEAGRIRDIALEMFAQILKDMGK